MRMAKVQQKQNRQQTMPRAAILDAVPEKVDHQAEAKGAYPTAVC